MIEYSTLNRIDEIFKEIEAQEAVKRERNIITFCLICFSLAAGFLAFSYTYIQNPLHSSNQQETVDKESSMLKISTSASENPNAQLPHTTTQPSAQASSNNPSQYIQLEIKGERVSAHQIEFRILNYDPKLVYRVDFGNGMGKKVRQTFTYAYPESGNYKLKIIGYGSNNQQKKLETNVFINAEFTAVSLR